VSKDALVEDIREDVRVAKRSLEREGYEGWRGDGWLKGGEAEDGQTVNSHGDAISGNIRPGEVGQKDHIGISQMQ
jgi:riboflavin kinase